MLLNNVFLAVCSSRDLNALALGFGLSSKAECECLQAKDVSQLQETVFFEGSFIRNLTPLGTGGSTIAGTLKETWTVRRLASVCVCQQKAP